MVKIKADQYWEWRTTVEEMDHSETKLKLIRMTHALMEKEIENQRLKSAMYKAQIKTQEEQHALAKKNYQELKLRIEKKIGQSLNNCVIDDVTFEVKSLDENSLEQVKS